jgi:uncharacterized phiE125 gp8 family phage protein
MAEPFTTAEAKKHLRVDSSADDTLIADNIVAAREWAEDYTGLILTRREVTEQISQFAAQTKLRAWPIDAAEPVSLVYRDSVGIEQTIADATMRAVARPAVLYPAAAARWPLASTVSGAIDVTFTAGFATPADIPGVIKQAMLLMLTAFYDGREGELFDVAEAAAKRLCRRHKRRTL